MGTGRFVDRARWLQDMSAAGRRARVTWHMECDELTDEQVGQLARVIDEARLHGEADQYARGYAAGRGGTLKAAQTRWSPETMRLRRTLELAVITVRHAAVDGAWATVTVDVNDLERALMSTAGQ